MKPDPIPTNHKSFGRAMFAAFWLVAIALMTWSFGNWEDAKSNPNQSPQSSDDGALRQVTLASNTQHHYVASGTINGHPAQFLLDTGATDVVLPAALAQRIGLPVGTAARANTANGAVTVYKTHIDRLTLGSIELFDIDASINPAMRGSGVLLGMSALRNIDFQQRQGQLILQQRY